MEHGAVLGMMSAFGVGGCWSMFGYVGKHQCLFIDVYGIDLNALVLVETLVSHISNLCK